jgi:hypothetical protein
MKTFVHPIGAYSTLLTKKITLSCCLVTICGLLAQSQVSFNVQPSGGTICTGTTITFTTSATGTGTVSYQWEESIDGGNSWVPLSEGSSTNPGSPAIGVYTGTNGPALTITRVPSSMHNYNYRTVATAGGSSLPSNQATLNVGPNITLDESSATRCPATSSNLTAPPAPGVSYQWEVSNDNGISWASVNNGPDATGVVYTGAATASLVISSLTPAIDNYLYRYHADDGSGCQVISGNIIQRVPSLATVDALTAPTAMAGGNTTIPVSVTAGTGPFSYRWQVSTSASAPYVYSNLSDNATYSGTTSSTLTITNVTPAMFNYRYRPTVRNAGNCATGNIAAVQIGMLTVLPVRLQTFGAHKLNNGVKLWWQVDPAFAARAYYVQKSTDGHSFSDIGLVNGQTGKSSYHFIDDEESKGTVQYRLRMMDIDGTNIYSSIALLTTNVAANRIELRPSVTNAASTSLFITLERRTTIAVTMADIMGRVQFQQTIQLDKGTHVVPIDIAAVSTGIYYVRITSDKAIIKVLPLVKQ